MTAPSPCPKAIDFAPSRIIEHGLICSTVLVGCLFSCFVGCDSPRPASPAASSAATGPPPPPPPSSAAASATAPPPPPPAGTASSLASSSPSASPKLAPTSLPPAPPPPPVKVERGASAAQELTFAKTTLELPITAKARWSPYPGTCVAVLSDALRKPVGAPRGNRVEIWDAAAAQRKGLVEYVPGFVEFALSPTGKYLALLINDNNKATQVQIWSVESGQPVQNWQADSKMPFGHKIWFAGDEQILILKPLGGAKFELWNIASGSMLREIQSKRTVNDKQVAIGADGTRLAVLNSTDHVVVVTNLSTGQTVSELPVESNLFSCQALTFSPHGEELAALFSGAESTVICWAPDSGQRVFEWSGRGASQSGLATGAGYSGTELQWLPDRSAFLLYGHFLLDRQSKRMVAMLQTAADDLSPPERRWIDSDRLALFIGPLKLRRLNVATIPWAQIDRSIAGLNGDSPAILKEGGSISLKIEIGELRGADAQGIIDKLTKAVSKALDEHQIRLAENQPVTLSIRYREAEGKELDELAPGADGRPAPLRLDPATTGRKVQSTRMVCELTLQTPSAPGAFWSRIIDIDPTLVHVRGDLTEASVREAVFTYVELKLSNQPYPYFIPADKQLAPLPVVLKLPSAH